ncbi:Putative lipoprotein [Helicobacter ailurogastricus]|uniref:COG3014 family protein n=1 Tax=Helicobacter ailurogastricus TaxID=1578720 RepID=UPI00244D8578|nr:hypothetical protein [Helicobacter ailurogastricus]GMB89734.1 Putative lipoprotein [Helicobacter ailurogastricus]
MKKIYIWVFVAVVVGLLVGCTGNREQFQRFDQIYYNGAQFSNAYLFSKKMAKKDHSNALLWDLQQGMSALMAGQYSKSIKALDVAELRYDHHHNLFSRSLGNVGAVLVNDNVRAYTGNIYEGVFLNYYKAIDYLLMGDAKDARVEFNRANDRQRRAKEFYNKEIRKAIEKMQQQGSRHLNAEQSNDQVQEILNNEYSNLNDFYAYNDLINPVVSYLSGLFFVENNDLNKGLDYLKEAYGISHSTTIGEDLIFFNNPTSAHFTWVFIEDGKQATKQEFKINIPLPLPNGIYDASLALPQLKDGTDFRNSFSVQIGQKHQKFENLLLLDALIASEFKKQLPYILTRAITSTAIKVGLEAVSNQYLGVLGGLFSSIYAAASTSADIRSPTIFPRKFYILRLKNTYKQPIHILADGQEIFNFKFVSCQISTPAVGAKAFCANQDHVLYIRSFENYGHVWDLW